MNMNMPKSRPRYLHHEKNRHGIWVWYVRVDRKKPRVRIRGVYGTPEFDADVDAAISGKPVRSPVSKPRVGSLRWLVGKWKESPDWADMANSTKRQRENILLPILAENGDNPFNQLTDSAIVEGMKTRKDTPFAANNFLKTMGAFFAWAKKSKHVEINPTIGVGFMSRVTEGFEPWTIEDVAKYRARWPLGTRQRLAMEILHTSGLRRGDAVRLGKQHMGADGLLHIKTEKTNVDVAIVITPELAAVIEAGPTGDLAYICGEKGGPLVKESFGTFFRKWCDLAKVTKSAHGLRKFAATELAEAGGTELELQATFGWKTSSQSGVYTKKARNSLLSKSAAAKRQGNSSIPAPQNDSRTYGNLEGKSK